MIDDDDPLAAFDDLPRPDPNSDRLVEDDWPFWRNEDPIKGLREGSTDWYLGWVGISKTQPGHRHGFGGPLSSESRFYKRRFAFPEHARSGWMIIFRLWDRGSNPQHMGIYETPAGWVPLEREKEADHWIAFLNQEMRARLRESGREPAEPDPAQGAIPPPAPPGRVPVPPIIPPGPPPSQLFPAGLARRR